jgi:hypothetical protein
MEIDPLQRELLIEETQALLTNLKDSNSRARYTELLSALEAGSVPESSLGALGNLLELGLQTGRLRQRYTAEGEQALLRLFHKTPRGAAILKTINEANRALESLAGHVLQGINFNARGPGSYSLTLETDQGHFALRIQREGVWVENVEIEM